MDKRYSLIIALLACAGAAVAAVLAYSHFFPSVIEGLVLCSGNYAGNCNALHKWRFAMVFGIPLGGYGLFMYLLIFTAAVLTSISSGWFARNGLAIVLPLIVASLLADVVLAGVMVRLKTVCMLCVTTYVINGLMLIACLLWYRSLRAATGFSLAAALWGLLPRGADSSRKKTATIGCFVLAMVFLGAIFGASQYWQVKAIVAHKERARQFVETFFQKPADKLVLPESSLVIGSSQAKVKFVVFTDFLCASCYEFYLFEKDLPALYGDKVSVTYYNYAKNEPSKLAAKAVLSAARLNVLPQYLDKHFSRYLEFRTRYSRDKAFEVAAGLADPARFAQEMGTGSLDDVLKRDFELGQGLNIIGTPTLFINGRRIDGVPSRWALEMIVDRELRKVSAE